MSLEFLAGLLWGVFTHSFFFIYGYLKGKNSGQKPRYNSEKSPRRIGGGIE